MSINLTNWFDSKNHIACGKWKERNGGRVKMKREETNEKKKRILIVRTNNSPKTNLKLLWLYSSRRDIFVTFTHTYHVNYFKPHADLVPHRINQSVQDLLVLETYLDMVGVLAGKVPNSTLLDSSSWNHWIISRVVMSYLTEELLVCFDVRWQSPGCRLFGTACSCLVPPSTDLFIRWQSVSEWCHGYSIHEVNKVAEYIYFRDRFSHRPGS